MTLCEVDTIMANTNKQFNFAGAVILHTCKRKYNIVIRFTNINEESVMLMYMYHAGVVPM